MEAEISNYSEEQAEAYYASMKDSWDRYAIEETARKEGELEGYRKGLIEGKQEAFMEEVPQRILNGVKEEPRLLISAASPNYSPDSVI